MVKKRDSLHAYYKLSVSSVKFTETARVREKTKKKRQMLVVLTQSFVRPSCCWFVSPLRPTRKRWLHSEINWAINLLAVITHLFGVFYKYTTRYRITRQFERIGCVAVVAVFFFARKTEWLVIGGKSPHTKKKFLNGKSRDLGTKNAHEQHSNMKRKKQQRHRLRRRQHVKYSKENRAKSVLYSFTGVKSDTTRKRRKKIEPSSYHIAIFLVEAHFENNILSLI